MYADPDVAGGKVTGLSLQVGVAARAHEREKLERLCRYIARPTVSEKRLSLLSNGHLRCETETQYRDGTTHVIVQPLNFVARLVAEAAGELGALTACSPPARILCG